MKAQKKNWHLAGPKGLTREGGAGVVAGTFAHTRGEGARRRPAVGGQRLLFAGEFLLLLRNGSVSCGNSVAFPFGNRANAEARLPGAGSGRHPSGLGSGLGLSAHSRGPVVRRPLCPPPLHKVAGALPSITWHFGWSRGLSEEPGSLQMFKHVFRVIAEVDP